MSGPFRNNRRNSYNYNESINTQLVDFYVNLYNNTLESIDSLYNILHQVRNVLDNIQGFGIEGQEHINQTIYHPYDTIRNRDNRNRSSYRNRQNRNVNHSENNNILYREIFPIFYNRPNTHTHSNASSREQFQNEIINLLQQYSNPVPIVPTATQIENSTRTVVFSSILNPTNNTCPITLERFDSNSEVTQLLGCNHLFNPTSIQLWFQNNVRCPICRYDIRDYVVNNTNDTNNVSQQNGSVSASQENNEEIKEDNQDNARSSRTNRIRVDSSNNRIFPVNFTFYDISNNLFDINSLNNITDNLISQLLNSSTTSLQSSYFIDPSSNITYTRYY
jgi:hypothetical protein